MYKDQFQKININASSLEIIYEGMKNYIHFGGKNTIDRISEQLQSLKIPEIDQFQLTGV